MVKDLYAVYHLALQRSLNPSFRHQLVHSCSQETAFDVIVAARFIFRSGGEVARSLRGGQGSVCGSPPRITKRL